MEGETNCPDCGKRMVVEGEIAYCSDCDLNFTNFRAKISLKEAFQMYKKRLSYMRTYGNRRGKNYIEKDEELTEYFKNNPFCERWKSKSMDLTQCQHCEVFDLCKGSQVMSDDAVYEELQELEEDYLDECTPPFLKCSNDECDNLVQMTDENTEAHQYTVDTPTLRGTKKDKEMTIVATCPKCGESFEV